MTFESPLNKARSMLEEFDRKMYGENAAVILEDGLIKLKEIADHRATEKKELEVINNLVNLLFDKILAEANRLHDIKPLARREDVEHWLEIMRTPHYAGWELSEAYLEAGKEHVRLLRIIKDYKGHLSKEDRWALLDADLSFLDETK